MTPCDEWEGACSRTGYGSMRIGSSTYRVTRLVWMQDNGHTDDYICHTCDNPTCINIEHLFVGTQYDNMRDMARKGRGNMQKKVTCANGHSFDYVNAQGHRVCRSCARNRMRHHRAKETA